MANSPTGFNEADFPEYDPTPYGGGFDLAQVYGQSLPPSHKICYPRSTSSPNWLNSEGFSYGSIKAPYGEEPVDSERPQNGGVTQSCEEERPSYVGNWNWPQYPFPTPANGYDYNCESIFSYGYENGHCFGYGGNHDSNYGYGSGHDHGYGDYGKPVDEYKGEEEGHDHRREEHGYGSYDHGLPEPRPAYDYHPNHVEPFSGLLANWPCLSREYEKRYHSHDTDEQSHENQWKQTADYLFGYPYAYDENRDENYGYQNPPTYCYEQHNYELPHHVQHQYVEPLQFQNPSHYGPYHGEVYPRSKYGDDS